MKQTTPLEVRPLKLSDRDALLSYLQKAYPTRANLEHFIDFTLFSLPNKAYEESLVVVNGSEIVGANMFLPAEVRFNGATHDIVWSYDTKILDEYRNTEAGTLLMTECFIRKNSFGAGLSSIAIEMNHKMHSKWLGYSRAFIKLNLCSRYLLNLIQPLFAYTKHTATDFPDTISIFHKITDVSEIHHAPYWNNEAIEFSRSQDFLKWRFFSSPEKYVLYYAASRNGGDAIYFVVREMLFRHMPFLFIVDYRFNIYSPHDFATIIDAVTKLAKELKLTGTYTRSSMTLIDEILKHKGFIRKRGQGADIVTRYKPAKECNLPILYTPADSDMDFKEYDNE